MRFSSLGGMSRPSQWGRLLRTVRHLKQRQIAYGIRYRLLPKTVSRPWPLRDLASRQRIPRLQSAPKRMLDDGPGLTFQNLRMAFSGDWRMPGMPRLWEYNLHYMGWTLDLETGREEWMRRWIQGNPSAQGGVGWEPYPLSMRLMNWCKHFARSGSAPDPDIADSMGLQAARLWDALEFHLDGNHLLENLLALGTVCCLRPAGSSHDSLNAVRAKVFDMLTGTLEAQTLEDGGHCELSPMYHGLILDHLLDLINCWPDGNEFHPRIRAVLIAKAEAMLAWLQVMSLDGEYSLFNDGALDAAPRASEVIGYGERLLDFHPAQPGRVASLASSGYHRIQIGPWRVLFDGGRLGPDYQMGHAHCDMLSFCLWYREKPLVVHPGTFEYTPGPMREYGRSTASHNTVTVDGQEQAELWGAHRVGRRGGCDEMRVTGAENGPVRLVGGHHGFAHMPGNPVHERTLEVSDNGILVRDGIRSGRVHAACAFFHLTPESVVEIDGNSAWVRVGDVRFVFRGNSPPVVREGWYSPEFGIKQTTPVLVWNFGQEPCEVAIRSVPG